MQLKPLRPCNKVGCHKLTRNSFCEDHLFIADEQKKDRHKYYDRYKRDKKGAAFYKSREWLRVREQALLRDKGLCRHCIKNKKITFAEMVDHIIPIKVDWHLRLDLNNLQSLCNRCHAIKTAEDDKKYPRG